MSDWGITADEILPRRVPLFDTRLTDSIVLDCLADLCRSVISDA